VARLAHLGEESARVVPGILPLDVPPARARHARHARTAEDPAAPRSTPLSIRSAERRRWSAELTRPDVTAVVLYGMGGIGKSTLAGQIASRESRLAPEGTVSVLHGEVPAASLVAEPAETDLMVLDDFGENLSREAGPRSVRDPALAALLAGWAGKILITCETPFSLPEAGPGRFVFRHVGPLTRSGGGELALSLPAFRWLTEPQRNLAWRLTGGHPRAKEYLVALLGSGARFEDVADRIAAAAWAGTGPSPARTEPTELPEAAAEAVAARAGRLLLAELNGLLSAGARDLLVRASVFRVPVEAGVLAARPANLAECLAAGLLAAGPARKLAAHRWTAAELHRSLAAAGQTAQLADAHREAAAYWQARIGSPRLGPRAELEASYHARQAAGLAAAAAGPQAASGPGGSRAGRGRLRRLGLASAAGAAAAFLAIEAAGGLSASHLAAAERSDQPTVPAPFSQASAVREQAGAWLASQISADVIFACDPVMCSVLVGHGIPAADLLVLGPGAADPLGSAVVVATPAVRAMFGNRLAGVYAPQVLASFGAGATRIDVRAVAPDGAAAYRTVLAADLQARRAGGLQLLADPRVSVLAPARIQLADGSVDARLLITVAALAAAEPVRVLGFADAGPGSGSGTPLRTAELVAPARTAQAMLTFLRAQRPPYLPARSSLSRGPDGQWTLTIQFTAPSPLGLLAG
jgi:hypothetical protein